MDQKYETKHNYSKNTVTHKDILTLTQGTVLNYVMTPLIGAVDTYWISKLNNGFSILAGQGTADRLFNSIYSIASFYFIIITPLVSKYHANNDTSQVSSIVTTSACVVTCGYSIYVYDIIFQNIRNSNNYTSVITIICVSEKGI